MQPDENNNIGMSLIISPHHLRLLLAGLCLLALGACGTLQSRESGDSAMPTDTSANNPGVNDAAANDRDNSHDPLEGFNRAMYTFNDKLDKYALKPLAKGYRAIT